MSEVKAVPDRFHTVTPYLIVDDATAAIDFYKGAFGAEEIYRMPGPDGKTVMHAELKIGSSMLMLGQSCPDQGFKSPNGLGGTPVSLHLYVEDSDAAQKRATDAGAKEIQPQTDQFWGDRMGKVSDPYGHQWSLATHKKDLTPEEMGKAAAECFKNMEKK